MANAGTPSSVTQRGLFEPFELQVARGQIAFHSVLNIYGYQPVVGTSFIPVWENATTYTYPVAAMTMYLVGTDSDTAKVRIDGLDGAYNAISEVVTLNGTTPVATTKQFFRVNGMQVTSGNPAATVTLQNVGGTVVYAKILTGVGRTQAALYTVPAGHTFYLARVNVYTSLNGNDYVTYQNRTVSSTGVVTLTQQAPFPTSYEARRVFPRPFLEKTDIQLQCKVQTGTGAVGVAQEGILIANSYDVGHA